MPSIVFGILRVASSTITVPCEEKGWPLAHEWRHPIERRQSRGNHADAPAARFPSFVRREMRVRECRLSLCLTSVAVTQHWCRDQHLASLVFRSGPEGLPMTAQHFRDRSARSFFATLFAIAFLVGCSTMPTQTGPTAAERAKTIIANPIRTE